MTIKFPTSEQISKLRTLWQEAFGDTDAFLDVFFETAFKENRCRCVFENGQAIAALYWFDCSFNGQKIAYIYAVATKKTHRGKGICKALMEDVHSHLKKEGYKGAVLVPGTKELFGFYEKMNYKTCCFCEKLSCVAGNGKIQMSEIDENEFAKLRRQFLPKGGIVQENENLAFLKATVRFFRGDEFLLAARIEENELIAVELLGDASLAPKIVNTFGCKTGTFKTLGNTTPFAMFFSFTHNTEFPNYLGFAFD